MKKFLFLAHGEIDRTSEFHQAQRDWWKSIQDSVVDSGNPLMNGRSVTRDGDVMDIATETTPAVGYSIVQAESMEEALALVNGSPMDMWVYEAMPM